MNKYEKSLMFNVTIMKIGFVIIALTNFFLPVYKDTYFQFSLFQIGVIIIWFYGLMNGIGYGHQNVPIVAIGLLRIAEAGYHALIHFEKTNWWVFLVFIVMDVIYLAFLLIDKSSYTYTTEEVDNSAD